MVRNSELARRHETANLSETKNRKSSTKPSAKPLSNLQQTFRDAGDMLKTKVANAILS